MAEPRCPVLKAVLKELLMLGMVERQWQGGCSVDSGLTHKGGMRRVVGAPSGL